MAVNDDRASSRPLIEKRSIDYIPEAERHGRLFSQFTLWLGANLQITAIVTGALAVVLGWCARCASVSRPPVRCWRGGPWQQLLLVDDWVRTRAE